MFLIDIPLKGCHRVARIVHRLFMGYHILHAVHVLKSALMTVPLRILWNGRSVLTLVSYICDAIKILTKLAKCYKETDNGLNQELKTLNLQFQSKMLSINANDINWLSQYRANFYNITVCTHTRLCCESNVKASQNLQLDLWSKKCKDSVKGCRKKVGKGW
jgi:hypothetical protein